MGGEREREREGGGGDLSEVVHLCIIYFCMLLCTFVVENNVCYACILLITVNYRCIFVMPH